MHSDSERADSGQDPRFAADCMLGTLAKWLKILGYDTLYLRKVDDADLVERARAEQRILLTRDSRMVERRRARPFLLIKGEHSTEQLREVIEAFDLEFQENRILTRCLPCNELTQEVDREEVKERVPPYVRETQERFRRCPTCHRIYWGATHRTEMVSKLRQLFDTSGHTEGPSEAAP